MLVQDVNIATHPVTGWPAVAATAKYDQTDQPSMVVARVYHPTLHRWSAALQLDTGAATSGTDRFASSAIAITGDNTVHVVWGSSDADAGLWYAASADFGTSWSAPLRIGADCWFVNDLKATPDGQLVVLAACYRSRSDSETQPGLIVRRASGQWQPLERIGVPGWFGALAIAGDGDDALVTAFVTPHAGNNQQGFLISKYLKNPAWAVRPLTIQLPGRSAADLGDYHQHIRGLAYPRRLANGQDTTAVVFTWTGYDRKAVYALQSLDGGLTWCNVEEVVYQSQPTTNTAWLWYTAPSVDVTTGRMVVLWACCGMPYRRDASHLYSSWSVPGTGVWHASLTAPVTSAADTNPDHSLMLEIDARTVGYLDSALAPNTRKTWLAWVEDVETVQVQSVELFQLIPADANPTAVPVPTVEVP